MTEHDGDEAQVGTGTTGEAVEATETAIPELVIISGMSGAGRSTAAKCLEDLGWFVVDNLPPALIPTMVELGARSQGNVARIAVVAFPWASRRWWIARVARLGSLTPGAWRPSA